MKIWPMRSAAKTRTGPWTAHIRPHRASGPSVWGKLPFYCLVGFVATQGFLIPVMALPVNWAMWPSLPDIFGYSMFASVLLSRKRQRLAQLESDTLRDLLWMLGLFAANFLFVTVPNSQSGVGVKFGGFTLLLLIKYILVFWAASHIPMTNARLRMLQWASFLAFAWIIVTMVADRFHLIEIDRMTGHLPAAVAGHWGVVNLNSTVGPNHGQTSTALLLLSAFSVMSAGPLLGWLTEALVLLAGGVGTFLTGSRQGVVRFATFVVVYLASRPKRLLLIGFAMAFFLLLFTSQISLKDVTQSEPVQASLERQMVLLQDPLTSEGLSGRPEIWRSVLDTLSERPIRWIIGYGIGNYAEFKNAAHNMVLQLLQDGGVVLLVGVTWVWISVFRRVWHARHRSWHLVALTAGLLSSAFTSGIFYPNLASGWYLGFYFVSMHVCFGAAFTRPSDGRTRGPS